MIYFKFITYFINITIFYNILIPNIILPIKILQLMS